MSTQTTPTPSKIRVPSTRTMTPEKYKALSPEVKRLYSKKARAANKAFDAMINKRNAANHEKLARSLPGIIAQDLSVEWEIVHNFLRRTNQLLVPAESGN